MKYVIICLSLPVFVSLKDSVIKSSPTAEEVKWISWEQAAVANTTVKKKILVDIYTDWCRLCKVMDRETFADEEIASYINIHYYAVKLDAEQKEIITWNNHEFKWIPSGRHGLHELAYVLCDGEMSYPTYIFLTENHERIRISKGFKDARTFLAELVFAAEEHYMKNSGKP